MNFSWYIAAAVTAAAISVVLVLFLIADAADKRSGADWLDNDID